MAVIVALLLKIEVGEGIKGQAQKEIQLDRAARFRLLKSSDASYQNISSDVRLRI